MDTSTFVTAITKLVSTQEEALQLIRLIREYLEEYFFSKPDLTIQKFISSHNVSLKDNKLLSSLDSNFFKTFTRNNFYEILKDITAQIEKYPVVTVYVPVEIDALDIQKLGVWFKENLSPTSLMDLKTDDKLVGGISFVWKGVKHEYSFKMLVDRKKDEILEMVDTVGLKNILKSQITH